MNDFHTCIKQWGDNLLYVGYENGKRVQKRIPYKGKVWAPCESQTGITDIFGNNLQQLDFDSIKDAKDYINRYKDVENFKVYGTSQFQQLYIAEKYNTDIEYNISDILVFTIDIENMAASDGSFVSPEDATSPITVITIHNSKTSKFMVFANTAHTKSKVVNSFGDDVEYMEFDNEYSMLNSFLIYWESNYPDIVTGWNTRGYDIVYIINRMNIVMGEKTTKRLSPWGIVTSNRSNVKRFGRSEDKNIYELYGINELDYMDLYMKYNISNSESFALDFICEKELGENKISYKGSLDDLYINDIQTYIEYNIHDVRLVVSLDKKKQFITLIVDMSYFGKTSMFNDTLGTVRYWEYLIFYYLYHQKNIPEIVSAEYIEENQYVGAFVKEPVPGLYKWVVSVDATSLYPSIIRQLNIGPDTHICASTLSHSQLKYRTNNKEDYFDLSNIDNSVLLQNNWGLGCNNEIYNNDKQSFLSALMEMLFNNRKQFKATMLSYKKECSKIGEELEKRGIINDL